MVAGKAQLRESNRPAAQGNRRDPDLTFFYSRGFPSAINQTQ